jgi:3-oxoacyl-[acyl-carrier protein] reductase
LRFQNKKVFVTGASRGIGRAIAEAFRAEGAWVAGTRTGKRQEDGSVCQEWFEADFSDIDQISRCADYLRKIEPDVLVNNAGINKTAPFIDIIHEDFRLIQQVNVYAPFILCQAAIRSMKQKRWGRIVNVSSIWGKISMAHRASYSASKFAIDGMTLALAAEYSSEGIIANCIAPGFIDTDLTHRVLGESGIQALVSRVPVNRLGRVDEIARLVLWLASEENTFIIGQNIAIDGGYTRV